MDHPYRAPPFILDSATVPRRKRRSNTPETACSTKRAKYDNQQTKGQFATIPRAPFRLPARPIGPIPSHQQLIGSLPAVERLTAYNLNNTFSMSSVLGLPGIESTQPTTPTAYQHVLPPPPTPSFMLSFQTPAASSKTQPSNHQSVEESPVSSLSSGTSSIGSGSQSTSSVTPVARTGVPSAAADLAEGRKVAGFNVSGLSDKKNTASEFRTGFVIEAQYHATAWDRSADPETDAKFIQGQSAKIQSCARKFVITEIMTTGIKGLPVMSSGGEGPRDVRDILVVRLISDHANDFRKNDANRAMRVTIEEGHEIAKGSYVHLEHATPVFYEEQMKAVGQINQMDIRMLLGLLRIDLKDPHVQW